MQGEKLSNINVLRGARGRNPIANKIRASGYGLERSETILKLFIRLILLSVRCLSRRSETPPRVELGDLAKFLQRGQQFIEAGCFEFVARAVF